MRLTLLSVALTLASALPGPVAAYDVFAAAKAETLIGNVETGIPSQCYTKTGSASNPCWACHTTVNGRNRTDDWALQAHYDFSDIGKTNHWTNLFKDRRPAIAQIDDAAILAWVRQDNAAALTATLSTDHNYQGWRPDLDFQKGFDADGFALDGSGWRSIRYKPFVGTFWPTNGSTDEVMIRLPDSFRQTADGKSSDAIYRINLAILEAAVSVPDTRPDDKLNREVEPLDEAAAGLDLDGDGHVGGMVRRIRVLPKHYAGAAAAVPVVRFDYPVGTEFLHTVRYLDPDADGMMATRFKELRHSVKRFTLNEETLGRRYDEEAREQTVGGRPHYAGNAYTGQTNAFGWNLQGFIENDQGQLRLQTREEQLYCMGCHSGIGITVDNTFSLPRKLPGAAGWGRQSLAGIQDAPQAGSHEPEYRRYLERVRAGDEFRANTEMLERFFPHGVLRLSALLPIAPGGHGDIRDLILPSRSRALTLDKAYRVLVAEQSYRFGRDTIIAPAQNVYDHLENTATPLDAAAHVYKDGRLWLDWGPTQAAAR
jgi:hypothetical protein